MPSGTSKPDRIAGPSRNVSEHIAAAEDYIRGSGAEKVMLAPAVPDRDLKKTDDAVVAMVPDRSHKAQAPEPLVPTNRFGSPDGSLKHFHREPCENRRIPENDSRLARSRRGQSAGGRNWTAMSLCSSSPPTANATPNRFWK